ncbi:MAG: SAM-dependent DNA methyltransferase [Candidatus Poribacteria bacterium]|nr:SAM-dependent DNA methyltransferase [Candidatus Poribacteria bacterium]
MKRQIGHVFTPQKWAEWLINKWDIFDAWIDGAHICDPTAGQGAFVLAMLHIARNKGISITPERLSRLTLIELVPSHLDQFKRNVLLEFGIDFPTTQLYCQDIITEEHEGKYDILIGNPPWVNFGDLPTDYKTYLKPYFIKEGLIADMQRTLLGSSRVDIAALVLKVVLGKLLKENGSGYFYLPTSLFFGDGAHRGFRSYNTKCSKRSFNTYRNFAIDSVYEFTSTKVFEGVSTAYCCARFQGDTQQKFPVSYFKEKGGKWVEYKALPLKNPADPWRIVHNLDELNTSKILDISLTPEQKPRQGVNTCGANSIFIFDHKPSHLPDEFLYPLVTKEIWRQHPLTPQKWILLPYHRETGKPLTWEQIQQNDTLSSYLLSYQDVLQDRKGTLLRSVINRENWWAMLGVGTYSFAPFKVIWEAYGSKQFIPIILSSIDGQMWQGNQAMHAFIPCWSEDEAHRIKTELENPEILNLLQQLNGAGKCNWAQPGKMKKILSFSETENMSIEW